VLAAIRPDSWNYALFLHVLGAALLVGALVTAVAAQAFGWARTAAGDTALYARLSFQTLLLVAIPAWFAMRAGAEWIYAKEHWADSSDEPGWLGIGYITADLGGLLLLVSVVLAGFGARRLSRRGEGSDLLARSATVLVIVTVAIYLVALWAMTAKPD
jgi:phosphoglycerol transferase MdoB-like AlkP superfamily enzyme